MTIFEVETKTTGREVYRIEADSSLDAMKIFNDGGATSPVVSEVDDATIVRVQVADAE